MKLVFEVVFAVAVTAVPAMAQQPAKRIAGYQCMMLNITEQQSMDPAFHVSLRSVPSDGAPEAGWAGSVPIVREPAVPRNGFLQVLKADGSKAWIAAGMVKPYHPVSDSSARCVPEVLPNGRVVIAPGYPPPPAPGRTNFRRRGEPMASAPGTPACRRNPGLCELECVPGDVGRPRGGVAAVSPTMWGPPRPPACRFRL